MMFSILTDKTPRESLNPQSAEIALAADSHQSYYSASIAYLSSRKIADMFGMKSKKNKEREKAASRKRKRILFCLLLPVFYVLGTGPALWSRSHIENKHYRKGVVYYVAPLMWLNHQFRDKSLIEKAGVVDLTRSDDTRWYDGLESYWSWFGNSAVSEANKITMMLKFKFTESPILGN